MRAVSGMQMRSLDRRTIEECGISGEVLMETAGQKAADSILEWISGMNVQNVVILAGKGNNGGDAFVVAGALDSLVPLQLFCIVPESELSGDALVMFRKMPEDLQKNANTPLTEQILSADGTVIVDGLLGTGFHGELREPYRCWCRMVNASGKPVAALDIPSGLDADSGKADPEAVHADITFTMAAPKTGMFSPDGIRLTGRLRVLDIGIPESFTEGLPDTVECTDQTYVLSLLKREPFDIHKNSRGHLYVVGGSRLYPGAPLLASSAALHSGAGLVSCFLPENTEIYASVPMALILRKLPAANGFFSSASELDLSNANALVIGPGMGTGENSVPFLERLLQTESALLLDADALNLCARYPELLQIIQKRKKETILTPHPGEMKRLCEALHIQSADRTETASMLAEKLNVIVVLKGARTIVAAPNGRTAVNLSGCAALATAGTGDILSGIIGAFLARGEYSAWDCARLGVFLHGFAAECAAPVGSRGWIADDFIRYIQTAIAKLNPVA